MRRNLGIQLDVLKHNRQRWDALVDQKNRWTIPASPDEVAAARDGKLSLLLTPSKPVPMDWYPALAGLETLCLASGGGQQAPLLAAAGAVVTTIDNSPNQLAQDQLVAEREGLQIGSVQGDMADLSCFEDKSFGLIFHPCSNCFSEKIDEVWQESFRVLRPGGVLLAGFSNPIRFAITDEDHDNGTLRITRKLPWSGKGSRSSDEIENLPMNMDGLLEFGHTLEQQIGGQMKSGFHMTAMFEDRWVGEGDDDIDPLSKLIDSFIATRSIKPASA